MFKCLLTAMAPAAALAALTAPASAEWMTDFGAAAQRAASEGKLVLVDFTGSDWCAFCMQLRR